MENNSIPEVFRRLQADGCIEAADIKNTEDGFFLVYRSLSDILAQKGISDFPDSDGVRLACSSFFDDWFLYAVPWENDYICSLLKLREQEHDAVGDSPADGDTPGVTISFIAFGCGILSACLADPTDEHRAALSNEINRVVAYRNQRHHKALKQYFRNPAAEGAYLTACLYTRHIASFARSGVLEVPESYKKQSLAGKSARLARFLDSLNREAGRMVCDHQKIFIKDPDAPDEYESAAILATHTANTSLFSFAAEVQYHAMFLFPLARIRFPLLGKSVYDSAIRADMTIGDTEFAGPAPFYRSDSRIVKRQYSCHKDKYTYTPPKREVK